MGAPRFGLVVLLGLLGGCSVSSLDGLGANTNEHGVDASFSGPVPGGKCLVGQDCTGCVDCKAWCACVAPGNAAQCLDACLTDRWPEADAGEDVAVGAGGTSGQAGAGGAAGATSGGAAGSSGTGGTEDGGVIETGGSGASGGTGGSGGAGGTTGGASDAVSCGATTCNTSQNQYCCIDGPSFSCQTDGTQCNGGVKLECDGPEDCGSSQQCCGEFLGANKRSYCASQCQWSLCASSADCAGNKNCKPSSIVPTVKLCL